MTIVKIELAVVLLAIGVINPSFARPAETEAMSDKKKGQVHFLDGQEMYQTPSSAKKDYWKDFIPDSTRILTSPLRWEKSDWIKASVVTGVTIGLYAYDQDIQGWSQRKRNRTTNRIASFAKPFGDGLYTLPSLGALYLYGHFSEDLKAQRTAAMSLESFMVSGIFTQAIKFSTHRHRPDSGDSRSTWDGPGFSGSNLSFPSGHSSSAFSIATVIASEYSDIEFVPPLAYGLATLTALSRINDNDHWVSDVFLGSAIGYFTAKAVINLHKHKENSDLVILPVINDEYAGLFVLYRF